MCGLDLAGGIAEKRGMKGFGNNKVLQLTLLTSPIFWPMMESVIGWENENYTA
jgi:hypothetical protein